MRDVHEHSPEADVRITGPEDGLSYTKDGFHILDVPRAAPDFIKQYTP
jgi:hypothetical protein